MRVHVTAQSTSVANGWATIGIDPSYPVLDFYVQKIKAEPLEALIDNITSALNEVLRPGIEAFKKKQAELKLQGKDFHPVDLGPRRDPPVPLSEAFIYTRCGSVAVLAAYLAAQKGLEASTISGKVLIENPGRGGGGHTVCAIQPFAGYPHGLLFEAAGGISKPFRPLVAPLKEGQYRRIAEDKSSFVLQLTGCQFELYAVQSSACKLGSLKKSAPSQAPTLPKDIDTL